MDLTTWSMDGLTAAILLICAYGSIRCWPDIRRSCRLRYRHPAAVRREFARALRSGAAMPTPELRRNLLEYVAVVRRQISQLRSAPMSWLKLLMAIVGALEIRLGLTLGSLPLVALGIFVASYCLLTNAYLRFTERRLHRTEQANGGSALPAEPYAAEPACVDMISN